MDFRQLSGRAKATRRRNADGRVEARPSTAGPVVPAAALAASLTAGAIALWIYLSALLPGQDLGDSASFQAAAGDHLLTPRQAYPLYHALGFLFVRLFPGNPAHAFNLVSAACGAAAVAVAAGIAATVSGSSAAALLAGLLLGGSYTFWSQAVTAEVYTLHVLLVACSIAALLRWERRAEDEAARHAGPLALFFAVYAVSFGNHLSAILLAPAFALFLTATRPRRRLVLRPRVFLLAAAIAAAGAAQYAWNLSFALKSPERFGSTLDLLAAFWFDVTKADWRASFVFGKEPSTYPARLWMYWFDLRQQFGVPGAVLAATGCVAGLRKAREFTLALLVAFASTWVFAFTYNVGDTHVFYLVPHLLTSLLAANGAAALATLAAKGVSRAVCSATVARATRASVLVLLIAYASWRIFDTYPALDRSGDNRAGQFMQWLTSGLDGGEAIVVADLNWQLQNGLDYYSRHTNRAIPVVPLQEVILHFPSLVLDNRSLGREVVLAGRAAADEVAAAYDGLLEVAADDRLRVATLRERLSGNPPGSIYVVALLLPYADLPLDEQDLASTLRMLAGREVRMPPGRFAAVGGVIGQEPDFALGSDFPYRERVIAGTVRFDVRMESYLPADTIRRAGFGHVLVGRKRVLELDRGVSAVVLDRTGKVLARAYLSGILAPEARYVVRPSIPSVLSLSGSGSSSKAQ
ncbi:MAG: protein O-mannosyl-transferase family [Vicinamibacterales bacterium]